MDYPPRFCFGARVLTGLQLGLLTVGLALGAPAPANNEFTTYAVGSADPQVLTELVRAAAGPDGHVSYDERQQRLMVLAPAEAQRRIADLVREAAPPPVNVRLEVSFRGQSRQVVNEASLSGEAGLVRESSLTHTTIRLQPQIRQESVNQSSDVQQILVVASGREAALRVGEEVPWLDWFLDYGLREHVLVERMDWQQVGSFLVVQPFVLENQLIRLRITPELRGLADGQSRTVRFAQAATEVVIPNGQSYPLAGLTQGNEFMAHFLVGRSSQQTTETLDISVTPRILSP